MENLRKRLEESYKLASHNAKKVAYKNKTIFDRKLNNSQLEAGDRVLVRNVRLRGKNKLADKWETDIHIVVKRAGDLPVYTNRPESKLGPSRTLHRVRLLPCSFLPAATAEISEPEPVHCPKTRQATALQSDDRAESELSKYDNEPSFQWDAHSQCEKITRFTTVHEYLKPTQKTDMRQTF